MADTRTATMLVSNMPAAPEPMPVSSPAHPGIILHPIVAQLSNAKGESDYHNGIAPDHEYDESEEATFAEPLQPIGSTGEFLLRHTLDLITGNTTSEPETAPRHRLPLKLAGNSMDRHRQQAIHNP